MILARVNNRSKAMETEKKGLCTEIDIYPKVAIIKCTYNATKTAKITEGSVQ